MRNTFKASWPAQIFYFAGAYRVLRGVNCLFLTLGSLTQIMYLVAGIVVPGVIIVEIFTSYRRLLIKLAAFKMHNMTERPPIERVGPMGRG